MKNKLKPLIDFVLCPFGFLIELWRHGPGEQWIAIAFCVLIAFTILVAKIMAEELWDRHLDNSVKTGVVVRKWYQPEHDQWAGKCYVHINERWHIVSAGTASNGQKRERDDIVSAELFESVQTNAIILFRE